VMDRCRGAQTWRASWAIDGQPMNFLAMTNSANQLA
jgi:hypothetical protein